MPQASGEKPYSPLVQGIITEANPLNAPEGSTTDEKNFVLDLQGGVRKRRKGFANANADFTKTVAGATSSKVLETFFWRLANLFAVVISFEGADETWIRFHSNDSSYTYKNEVQLATQAWTTTDISSVRDSLIITGEGSTGADRPILIEKDGTNLEVSYINIFIRDFELLDDGLTLSERPPYNGVDLLISTNREHLYNLLNAGWYATRRLESNRNDTSGDPIQDFADDTFNGTREYPSNADVPTLGINTDDFGNEQFQKKTLVAISLGNTEAPRGHYVYRISDFDRERAILNRANDGTESTSLEAITTISVA